MWPNTEKKNEKLNDLFCTCALLLKKFLMYQKSIVTISLEFVAKVKRNNKSKKNKFMCEKRIYRF
jgi:hypothetical protein